VLTVSNSLFCSTTSSVTDNVGGLVLRDSENVTITGNTFYDNVTACPRFRPLASH